MQMKLQPEAQPRRTNRAELACTLLERIQLLAWYFPSKPLLVLNKYQHG
jgi:hypothetical protein